MECLLWSGCLGRPGTRTSPTPSQVRDTLQRHALCKNGFGLFTNQLTFLVWLVELVEVRFLTEYGISALFSPRDIVESVVPRLCENGDCGPCAARPLWRGDGAPFRLGAREQRSRRRGGELQAQTSWVGDCTHQHSRLPEVWKDGDLMIWKVMDGWMDGWRQGSCRREGNGKMPAQQTDKAVGCMREEGSNDELTEQKKREKHHGVVLMKTKERSYNVFMWSHH